MKIRLKSRSGNNKGKKYTLKAYKPKPADIKKLREKRKNGSSKFARKKKSYS